MAISERQADVTWNGDLAHGQGRLTAGSGARRSSPDAPGSVTATCAFDRADDSFKISTIEVTVREQVPGLDQVGFETAAQQAEQGCPVSNALRHNGEMRLHATLDAG